MSASGSSIIQKEYDLMQAYLSGVPPEVVPLGDVNQITFPDLHGNVLGAMLRLEACGVLKIKDEEDRKRLAAIYQNGGRPIAQIFDQGEVTYQEVGECTLTDAEFAEFKAILDRAKFNTDQIECVRFIGDVLGDRGKNDIFMLYLLSKLKRSDLLVEINFSNHDLQFLAWYSATVTNTPNSIAGMRAGQTRSLDNFISFLHRARDQGEEQALYTEIDSLINDYKSMAILLQYSYDEKESPPNLKLYSHAPVGLEAIEGLCTLFHINYNESSPQTIAKSIDQINEKFQDLLANPQALFAELKREEYIHVQAHRGLFNDHDIDPMQTPLLYIAWNRSNKKIRGPWSRNFLVENIHGHAGSREAAFTMSWDCRGVKGTNLDYNNELGYSEPSCDVDYPLGGPGSLNCYLSKGPVLKPQWRIEISRVTSEINRLLNAKPPNVREAYLIFLKEPIVAAAIKAVQAKRDSCHVNIRELASLAEQFWQRPEINEVRQWHQLVVNASRVASKIDRHLNGEPQDFKEAYRLLLENEAIVTAAKEAVKNEGNSCHQNMKELASLSEQFWQSPAGHEVKQRQQLVVDASRVASEIERHLNDDPPNIKEVYWVLLNNASIIKAAKEAMEAKDACDDTSVIKLTSLSEQFWKNTEPPIDELKSRGVRSVISQIQKYLQNPPNLQAAYRLVKNNKELINFAKKTIPNESALWSQDMQILVLLATEVEKAVPSLWKRVCLGFLGGAVAGGLMGSLVPGIGNAFGGLIGGISGAVVAGVGFGVLFGSLGGWLGVGSWLKSENAMGERASKILEKVNNLDMNLRLQASKEFGSTEQSSRQTRFITLPAPRVSGGAPAQASTPTHGSSRGRRFYSGSEVKEPPNPEAKDGAQKKLGAG